MTANKRPAPTALPVQYRTLSIERDTTRAATDELIPISISSEEPVRRWFGVEVLGHSANEIDFTRAKRGLPLLLDHDTRELAGRVVNIALRQDGRLGGEMRFGSSPRARDARQEVLDDVRVDVSVGYRIDELKMVSSTDDEDTYRATKWTPMEVSLVSVPADITVGVGRNAETTEYPVLVRQSEDPTPAPKAKENPVSDTPTAAPGAAPPANLPGPSRNYAQDYVEIENMVRSANLGKSEPLVSDDERRGFIERGMTPDAVAKAIFTKMGATIREIPSTPAPSLDRPNSEVKPFSIGRAMKALYFDNWKDAGYEREVSEAMRQQIGETPRAPSIYIPMDQPLMQRTSLSAAGSTTGQKTVFTEPGSFIEFLANTAVVPGLGPLRLSGLQGNVAMPRKATKGTAAWYAELFGGTDATESNMTFDQVSLSPKTIASTESYSNQLFIQSVLNIDAIMRADIFENIALLYDAAVFHGSGASNQIAGLYTISGLNSVAFGGAITYAKLVDMETAIEADNANVSAMTYVTTPEIKGSGKKTVTFTTAGSDTIWKGGMRGEMNGYTAVASNQLSKTLGTGTNENGIIFGAWSQAIVADWGAVRMTIDPYTKARQDVVNITGVALMDFNVRHPEAFTKGTGLTV